jgi:proteasome lid subunit RPN8/RPN11
LSQTLILNNWQDTKFGTIANVIILSGIIIGFSQIKFRNEYRNEVNIGLEESRNLQKRILTEAKIGHLPEPVRKYIRYTGCITKPIVNNFRAYFSGKIRSYEKKKWMKLSSEQYNFIKTSTRLFYLDATMKGLPVAGFHSFTSGVAYMDIRLFSMFKMEYQSGTVMNTSETVTFFNDMCVMAPATLIDD